MYEGNIEADELRLNNSGMSRESILLIMDVILRDIDREPLNPDKVNWNNLLYTVEYLGIGVSVDFIYPLFLTPQDRKDWYDTCELRRSYLCNYSEEEEGKLIEIHRDEIHHGEMITKKPDYNIIGKDAFKVPSYIYDSSLAEEVIMNLNHIDGLFVVGEYPLAKFDNFKRRWNNVDIFAYGPNAVDHIIEGVKICLNMFESKTGRLISDIKISAGRIIPIRSKYSIAIPINDIINETSVLIQFILIESKSPFHILNIIDIDASCIGFKISNSNRFYSLQRFIRALETGTNTTDPTRQSPTYIEKLIEHSHKGFDITVPGFNSDSLKLSPEVLKIMSTGNEDFRKQKIRELNFVGLQALVISSILRFNVSGFEMNYDYVSAPIISNTILSMDWNIHEKASPFVVGDVLNEGQREYKFVINDIFGFRFDEKVSYTPKYPLIELMEDDPQNGMIGSIHQVKTSFYGGYYNAKPEFVRKAISPRRSFRSRSPSRSSIKSSFPVKSSFSSRSSFIPSRTKPPQSSFSRTKSSTRPKPPQSSFSRTGSPPRSKPPQSSFPRKVRSKFYPRSRRPK
uniref:Ankyrin repeat protein n=1 Tax=Pithovirus LCPAC403 TaxID=2506596 RepID=A0A481ZE59_9VIRU|nr:MAG: ankyrin repeat protein [Pithovirus LCPAC403]